MQDACKSNVIVMNQEVFYVTTPMSFIYSNLINNKLTDTRDKSHKVNWLSFSDVYLQRLCGYKMMLYKCNLTRLFQSAMIRNLKNPIQQGHHLVIKSDIPKTSSRILTVNTVLKKDLLNLCSSTTNPPQYHSFYES